MRSPFHFDFWKALARCISLGAVSCFLAFSSVQALDSEEADRLLKKADTVKSSNYAEFLTLMAQLEKDRKALSQSQLQYTEYLKGWKAAYDGRYSDSIQILKSVASEVASITLRFRAGVTLANVYVLDKQHKEAFFQLGQLLTLLPDVPDKEARIQGLAVTAALYNQVGEFELALRYSDYLVNEDPSGRGACYGGHLKIEALYKSTKPQEVMPEFQPALAACEKSGEASYSNAIRAYLARWYIDQGRADDAIRLLTDHYPEVVKSQYPRLLSDYDSLLATAYRQRGDVAPAKQFALRTVNSPVKNDHTQPLVSAYRVLYLIAKERGESKDALIYLEKHAAADKSYLDDVSARQLAYQRVKHEVDANRLQIDALNKQNEVLQLQRALSQKAVENIRLYIALLAVILISIALWAYKTKRSQMHFMKLSRRDGLTGIYNRPHFIELSESTLKSARKSNQEVCVVLCDLDHFKAVNDNYGHAEGDYVLQRAVTACQMYLRASDVFARIGGEEFGVLLPGCTMEEARTRVERLRVAVTESNPSDGKFKVSASFGISSTSTSGYELQTLMTHADAALYQAKRSGRNCVVAYDAKDPAITGPRVVYVEGVRAS
jgi:diguanylate cyclase (GGDEF)-like protein